MAKIVEFDELRNEKHVFKNREHAARLLVESLKKYAEKNPIVLAIPSGGVPIGKIISAELNAEFYLMITKKIQFPNNPEAGFGAVSFDGEIVVNEWLIEKYGLTEDVVNTMIQEAKEEVERRAKIFYKKPLPELKGRYVILVDDGIATSYTMLVAIRSVKKHSPKKLIVALPTGNTRAIKVIEKEVDEIHCLNIRDSFIFAVADAYLEWHDLSYEEVMSWLNR